MRAATTELAEVVSALRDLATTIREGLEALTVETIRIGEILQDSAPSRGSR